MRITVAWVNNLVLEVGKPVEVPNSNAIVKSIEVKTKNLPAAYLSVTYTDGRRVSFFNTPFTVQESDWQSV